MKKKRRIKTWLAAAAIIVSALPLAIVLVTYFTGQQSANTQSVPETVQPVQEPLPVQTPAPTAPPPTIPLETNAPPAAQIKPPSPAPTALPDPPHPMIVADITESDPELSETLGNIAAKFNCAAVSLAAFDGSNLYNVYQYGYADKAADRMVTIDTKFRVASLSKIIPTICALYLAEQDKLSLDEDISVYLGYDAGNNKHPDVPITPRMLMQHTSSLYDSGAFLSSRGALASTGTSTQDLLMKGSSFRSRAPGTSYEYTNFGIAVLGAVCEMVSGKLLDTLARDVIFTPLGIDAAFIPENLADTSAIAVIYNENHGVSRSVQSQLNVTSSNELGRDHHLAQGNLTISAIDYARILAMLCNGGTLGEVRILSEESIMEIHSADVNAGAYMQGLVVRYQQSAFLDDNVYWHTGSAYGELTQFIYCLENGRIVVVLTTGSGSSRESNGMIKACSELSKTLWEQ